MNQRVNLVFALVCAVAVVVVLAGSAQPAHTEGDEPPLFVGDDDQLCSVHGDGWQYDSNHGGSDNDEGEDEGDDSGGDDEGDDGGGDDGRIFCVCHVPRGDSADAQTICVEISSLCEHLAHGDELGRCPEPCGGTDATHCERGQYCSRPAGECADDAEGECVDVPAICPTTFVPVCGCDGRTYANECYAAGAGVTVEQEGACEGLACGGTAGDTCDADQYCRHPERECAEDAPGFCVAKPVICTGVIAPVCGCDGVTYDNQCLAAAAGVTVAARVPCEAIVVCGGEAGETCTEDQFCARETGQCSDDDQGICLALPVLCNSIIDPVCGCDGVTHDNECLAHAAGTNVAATGPCPEETVCGGEAGDTCADDEFCQTPKGACGVGEGVCTQTLKVCPVLLAPVCGCDGVTYDNECFATAAGVNVASDGGCTSPLRLNRRRWR